MVGAVLELSSSWVSSALSAPLQKPLFPVISMLTWNTKFRVNLPKFGPKTGPEIGSKKGFKTRPKWVFQFWPPFWSQFWAQFGFQFWSQFWSQFWVRFWSQFWAHFGSKSNSFCGFWLRCRSGASKETGSGAKMVPEAMRNHFAGTKVLRNTLQVSNQARESYIERSLTRIFPKCLLEVKAEKDFNICILDFWNCIFQDFSPILLKHLVLKPLWRQNLDPVLGTETWVETSVEGQTLSAGRLVRQTKHINRFSLEEGV